MFQRFHALRERREGGFTLIELLVVVLIIAILAAIAIPVFLNQRRKAWRSQIQSDLKNAAIALEDCSVDANGDYGGSPDGTNECDQVAFLDSDYGFNPSDGVTITSITASVEGYCIVATHDSLGSDDWQTASYDSAEGRPSDADTCPNSY